MLIHRKSKFEGPFAQSCIPTKLILPGKIWNCRQMARKFRKYVFFHENFTLKSRRGFNVAWSQARHFYGASAASNCVSLELYYATHCALAECPASQHAKSFHHVFTVCSMCSDIPKDSERSTCKLTWLINVSILQLCGLPEHDNRALVVLLETLPHCHGNHILFLQHVYQNAEPPLFCASQRMLNGILWTLL